MRLIQRVTLVCTLALLMSPALLAQPAPEHRPGGEVNIQLPDFNQGEFLGMTGHGILLTGLVV